MKYIARLPLAFGDVIMHDGVPELGVIEDCDSRSVEIWFNAREVHAVLSDAMHVQVATKRLLNGDKGFYYKTAVREAAHNAEIRLENLINANNIPKPVC